MGPDAPQGQGSRPPVNEAPPIARRHWWRRNDDDIRRWAELFQSGTTILRIAKQFEVDPVTISRELHLLGFTITPGHHMVEQLPLRYPAEFIELIDRGPDAVLEFVKSRVWGIRTNPHGMTKVQSFCEFVRLHHQGIGVKETARKLSTHRSTIAHWRDGTDRPYLIRAAYESLPYVLKTGWKLLPMHLSSGGNEPSGWIQVPMAISSYSDILGVLAELQPLGATYTRARLFGLERQQIRALGPELFAYLLGIMVGDSAKLGGEQARYTSMNLDFELTLKQPTNERLGEFVMMCSNNLGIKMERKKDKPPSGQQLLGKNPTAAYRWTSERSPLLAWMFSVGLGLRPGETTTENQLRMDWILGMPRSFRIRFIQGAADSDGTARQYVVDIASVPNAEFFTRLIRSLGMTSAHVAYENGIPLRTAMRTSEAARIPIFNEFVKSYRYQRMMYWA